MSPDEALPTRPRWRGVLHKYSFYVALGSGASMVVLAPSLRARLVACIYAATLAGLFAVSALYHRVNWMPAARRWMRRLDHTMIFVLIAGTYTPFAALLASGERSTFVLLAVWLAALSGAALRLFWLEAPKWVTVAIALAMGWVIVATTPTLAFQAGPAAAVLIILGGLLYTGGGLVYALRWPDPSPLVFGYHEIFHAMVVAAAAAHFLAITGFVLPRG